MTHEKLSPNEQMNERIVKILSAYFQQRGSFLAQVIRADLQSLGSNFKPSDIPNNGKSPTHSFSAPTLENPTIKPLVMIDSPPGKSVPTGASQPPANLETQLIVLVAQKTGFPENTIHLGARLLDDLNLDSIKGGELIADFAKQCSVAGKVDPTTLANASLQEILEAVREVMPTPMESSTPNSVVTTESRKDVQTISRLLLELVAGKTGFPIDSLSLQSRLLDDLNLDSIKTAELVAEAAKQLGVAGQIDPAQFANATLGEIAEILAKHSQSLGTDNPSPVPTAPSLASSSSPWVRNFVVEYSPEEAIELPAEERENWETANLFAYDNWPEAHILIVAESEETDWVQMLEKHWQDKGAMVEKITYEEMARQGGIQNPKYTHFLGILPQKARGHGDSSERLLRAMSRLRAIATPLSAKQLEREYVTVAYLQFGGGHFGRLPGMSNLEQCGTMGFAASLHLERADLKVRVIDLPNQNPSPALTETIIGEIGRKEAYLAVGYDEQSIRRLPRPKVQDRTQYTSRSLSWSTEDVVLITGGAKGITAECAIAFARLTGVKTALVGRSPHPQDDPLDASAREIAQTLRAFAEERLICRYYSCDVTDAIAVRELVEQVRQELGPITGVIHGSALNKPRRVENSTLGEAKSEVAPKVLGVLNLMEALEEMPPRLFVGFSSISAVLGLPGNTWYGFSNESLDLLLRNFGERHPETSVLAIAFSVWSEVGMGARMGTVRNLNRMGIEAMPTEDGVNRFLELMFKDPGDSQVVVTSKLGGVETMRRGFDTWRTHRYEPPASFSFIENIHTIELGVEVGFRTRLTLAQDSYVRDHIYNGSYLFPTVFGLEAMAQAAFYVSQKTAFSRLRLQDIRLERPIVVDPEQGVEIEIWARVLEKKSPHDPLQVRAEIRTERTGFTIAHFAATLILDDQSAEVPLSTVTVPDRPLDLDPKQDLYGWLLFQGTRFQRLKNVYRLNSKEFLFSTQVGGERAEKETFDRADGPFLLGDPYYRDSLLQSVQPIIPQDICLPIRIDRIDLYQIPQNQSCFGLAINEGREGKEYRTTVTAVNEQGEVLETLEGYQLRILEHRGDNPTAEEIANPGQRDERRLQEQLKQSAEAFGIDAPTLALTYQPGLQNLPSSERRQQEVPLFAKTVGNFLNPS